jgi:hypothetical protein
MPALIIFTPWAGDPLTGPFLSLLFHVHFGELTTIIPTTSHGNRKNSYTGMPECGQESFWGGSQIWDEREN